MALSAGTAYIDIKPELSGGPAGFGGALKGQLGGALGGVAKVAGGAALGIGTAIGTAVVKGIGNFADLQKGMNEVFTLLPGISADAMGKMTDQVKTFSKDFGVLPDEVVPALYQALSAGVPPDNVFDFLEVGQKAALGGVTDLTTAVDGISSVVNAYGSDVIGAADASDLMFTAVRLGKTNFEELSASLFQVIPTAAATGVGFSDITAALSALTAQGTPTSVATTQLRSAIVELSKDGSKTATTFEELSGQTFRDFIASGGDLNGALQIMSDGAGDLGVSVSDLFGSVEAGNAVLGLTSESGAALFTNALGEMADATGATDTAFDQMDQGLSRSWDKIKATVAVALTDIGGKLAPFVEKAAEWLGEFLPKAIDFFSGAIDALRPVFETVFKVIGDILSIFKKDTEDTTEAGGSAFAGLGGIVETFGTVISTVMGFVKSVLDGLRAFWDQWGSTIIALVKNAWETVKGIIEAAFNIIKGIFDVVLGILTGDWSRAWEGIKNIVSGVWDAIKTIVSGAFNAVITFAKTFVSKLWEFIKGGLERVLNLFKELPGKIWDFLKGLPGMLLQLGADMIGGLIKGLGDIVGTVAGKIKDGVSSAISKVGSFFGIGSPSKVFAAQLGRPLINFGTTEDVIKRLRASASTLAGADAAANYRQRLSLAGISTGAAAGGSGFTLEAGAVQINNPKPEPASEEIPRTLRRLERRYGRG